MKGKMIILLPKSLEKFLLMPFGMEMKFLEKTMLIGIPRMESVD